MLTPKAANELRKIGYKPTIANLKTFQRARGLDVTGTLDPVTAKALENVAKAKAHNKDMYVAGMKGFDVWKMEGWFNKLAGKNGKHIEQDGVMDPKLLDMIVAFKEKHPELKNVGRYAGNPVRAALKKEALEPKSAKETPSGLFYPAGKVGWINGRPAQGSHLLFNNWETRNGVDIMIPVGTPIYAVANGVIGSQIGPMANDNAMTSGNRLHLETGNDEFFYQHLSKLKVHAGQHVKKGQLLGFSGTGNGSPHLHFSARSGQTDRKLGI